MLNKNRLLALGSITVLLVMAANAFAVIVGSFSARFDDTLRGGGVIAEGAGFSGRADGVVNTSAAITIAGIPAGATVQRALLYWKISGGIDDTATVNAVAVTGVLVQTGGSTCWGVNSSTFRADVTVRITGNGVYTIGGLPSSTVATAADTDGVGLVVVYQEPASPLMRRVMIRDGAISTDGGGDIVTDTFTGVASPSTTTGRFHLVVADGQSFADGNLNFNGVTIATNPFPGSDGSMMDVNSYNVNVPLATANLAWSHNTNQDCLFFNAAVLDYNIPQSADLAITKTDGVTSVLPGGSTTYTITAANLGPNPSFGATVSDAFPAALTCNWTCSGAGGGVCAAAGSGAINNSPVTLPLGASVTYSASCNISPTATGSLVNTATVSGGAVPDPNPANNSATDTDTVEMVPPIVTTPTSAAITATTATLGGNVTFDGGSAITERGVVYSQTTTNNDPLIGGTGVTNEPVGGTTGLFAAGVTGLSQTTSHSFKAFATNAVGTSYTSVATFTTTCPTITLASLPDGNVNVAYTGSATASGGTGPYTYAVTSGAFPGGLSLTASGAGAGDVVGIPTTTGTYPFEITATDTFGAGTCTGVQSYSVVIGPEPGRDFFTLTPCRVLDTRNAVGPLGGPALVALSDRIFVVAGTCGIPADARAVSLNLAVTQPTIAGNIRLHPGGTAVPLVSSINFKAGQTRSNNAVIPLSALGELAAYLDQAAGTAHLILDVNGYFK